jgi:ATP-binding cassette subfamily C protein/ATP-binding cassette subfamily C protein LapB
MLIAERDSDGALLAFDGSSASWEKLTPTNQLGSVFYVWNQPKEEFPEDGKSWLLSAVKRFKPAIIAMLAFSFLGNIAALTLPIFVIFVYDMGIGTRSTNTVVMLAVGAGIVIATNLALRSIRNRFIDQHEVVRSNSEYADLDDRISSYRHPGLAIEAIRKHA